MSRKRRISLISLGGTISMTPTEAGVVPKLNADDLLAAVPGLNDVGVKLSAQSFRGVAGSALTFADLAELAELITAQIEEGADGIVVTQGTDTIEETAFFLDMTVGCDIPIVVTGAMRAASHAGADGPANLLAAIQVAAGDEAAGQGVLVVFCDEIHAARLVRKTHTTSPATFVSGGFGPLGVVVEGKPRLLRTTERVPNLPIGPKLAKRKVAVIPMGLGDDGELLRRASGGFAGLVIAAMGVGHVPDAVLPTLFEQVKSVPVVLASRTGSGPVLRWTYGFPGSERDLREHGLIGAGFLDPYKARILLQLLVAAEANHDEIVSTFAHFE
ncbi:MAG TPA: asparaginase [Pseudonocardiaceae bacterium]|jgi:L-asparaginase|nr:asparaginase [Pseudonocardiaceae bacterium]